MSIYDVFIAHAGADGTPACELHAALKRRGLVPFVDRFDLMPGDPWDEVLPEALADSRVAVILVGATPQRRLHLRRPVIARAQIRRRPDPPPPGTQPLCQRSDKRLILGTAQHTEMQRSVHATTVSRRPGFYTTDALHPLSTACIAFSSAATRSTPLVSPPAVLPPDPHRSYRLHPLLPPDPHRSHRLQQCCHPIHTACIAFSGCCHPIHTARIAFSTAPLSESCRGVSET